MGPRRALRDLDPSTLAVLIAVSLPEPEIRALAAAGLDDGDAPLPEVLVRLVACLRHDPMLGLRIERALAELVGPARLEDHTVDALTVRLRAATRGSDLSGVAELLWSAARTPGLAWRRLEERASRALVVLALSAGAAPRHSQEQLAAK